MRGVKRFESGAKTLDLKAQIVRLEFGCGGRRGARDRIKCFSVGGSLPFPVERVSSASAIRDLTSSMATR